MKTTIKFLFCFITALAIMALTSCTKEIDTIITEKTEELSAVTLIQLNAIDSFDGPCSKTFDFEADIKADGPMTITYTWLRSDGATAPEFTLEFEEAGTKTVTTSWTLGETGKSYEGYWQQLKVISPEEMFSNKSEFNLNCDESTVEISVVATVIGDVEFTGECPKKFDFEAEITVDGPVTIAYTWLRSDGGSGPEHSLDFEEAGTKTVSASWVLGASGITYEGYWKQLKIIAPNIILSERATFDLYCEEDEVSITATAAVSGDDSVSGACPQRFDFEGVITTDGPATVTYTWLRSDGATAPEHTLEFTEAGAQTVTTYWELGGSGNTYENYWKQLRIITPTEILSERATFDLYCDEDPISITATAAVVGEDDFSGECPRRFEFEGVITVDAATTITYTWLRSDNATGPVRTIEFTEAGSETVTTSWTLGGSGRQYEGNWQQLRIITPEEVLSERAVFDLDCDGPTTIDFSNYTGESMNILQTAFADDGIESIQAAPIGSYCSDAIPAMLAAGSYNAPFSYLSTSRPGDLDSCNGVPLEFTFSEPVRRVTIEFYGAAVDYTLTAYNAGDGVLGTSTGTATPYDYSNPSTISWDEGSATIAKVTFGYTAALTQIRSITFE